MLDVIRAENVIPAMSEEAIDKVRALEALSLQCPQERIETAHLFHGGMYARTIMIPAGMVLTGALIRIATVLIVSGDCIVYLDGAARELRGYNVFAAAAHRKQAFVTLTDTHVTMLFPSKARTVEQAEEQFTEEAASLMSRLDPDTNTVIFTGE